MPILPALALVAWSREWIGWWALLPVGLLLGWAWVNPRVFPPPRSTANWSSHCVMGERLWLARGEVLVPPRHRALPKVLNAVAAAAGLPLVRGVAWLVPWAALTGLAVALLAKPWYLDRMV